MLAQGRIASPAAFDVLCPAGAKIGGAHCSGGVEHLSWVEQGLTSHQTHYRPYRWQMNQPIVSEYWKKIGPKDQASIPSRPPNRAPNNTVQHSVYAVWSKNTKYTQINKTQIIIWFQNSTFFAEGWRPLSNTGFTGSSRVRNPMAFAQRGETYVSKQKS